MSPLRHNAWRQISGALVRQAKIVATLGPVSRNEETIRRMIRAGVDVFRLNFSHGTGEEHAGSVRMIRDVAEREDRAVAVLQDLQGPRMRTGTLAAGNSVNLLPGQQFTLTATPLAGGGNLERVSVSYPGLPRDVGPNDRILIADGALELRVVGTTDTDVTTVVVRGGPLGERKGINAPGVALNVTSPTEKDLEDLRLGVDLGVDYVAISFVRDSGDIEQIRAAIENCGSTDLPVVAKLERADAIANLAEIIAASDAVMVARGDLGVELGPEKVPMLQKTILRSANEHGIPAITATQMLESMVRSLEPTRAEASDVANAVIDGSDALMLSAETTIGRYPAEAVQTMDRIAREVEGSGLRERVNEAFAGSGGHDHSLAHAAVTIAEQVDARAIVAFTTTGHTARFLSREWSPVPIYAFTDDEAIYRRMALWHSVLPLRGMYVDDLDALVESMFSELAQRDLLQAGDDVVVVRLSAAAKASSSNLLTVRTVGEFAT